MPQLGVLLINIGTPDSPDTGGVKKFLAEFLMDPSVLDFPGWLRWPLVHGLILPKRSRRSAKLYQQIWMKEGSPFLVHSKRFAERLQAELGEGYRVSLGMRYGNPTLKSAVEDLRNAGSNPIIVFPLYPQYSYSSTRSALEEVVRISSEKGFEKPVAIRPFYENSGFIDAYAARIQESLSGFDFDHLVFSYHGVPKRHLKRTEKSPHCLRTYDCCEHIGDANQDCYRAQCFATTRAICWKLKIPVQKIAVSFQSQMGAGWIEPFTSRILEDLGSRHAKRVAVVCPSFVTDCLETLEEIGMRLAQRFRELGGGEIRFVPSLNSDPLWIKAAAALVADAGRR